MRYSYLPEEEKANSLIDMGPHKKLSKYLSLFERDLAFLREILASSMQLVGIIGLFDLESHFEGRDFSGQNHKCYNCLK